MRESFSLEVGGCIVTDFIPVIQSHKQYLSDLDGKIGDGDHGINMNKGFTLFQAHIEEHSGDLAENLSALSRILMGSIGGSMGPLYGMLFRGMAKGCQDQALIDKQVMHGILSAGLAEVRKVSEAQVGDKTMMDVLIPAVESYGQAIPTRDFQGSMEAMRDAAMAGRQSTLDMMAKVGRSSRLGERSRGVLDAGSVSCCLILTSMADSVAALLSEEG